MKKNNLFTVFLLLLFERGVAQFTQLELLSGVTKTSFTSFSIKPIDEKKVFSISTLAFFQKYHKTQDIIFDEVGVQVTPFWNFAKSLSIGPTLYYNSAAGFSKRASLLFIQKRKHLLFSAIPSVVHTDNSNTVNGELFIQAQFTHPLKKKWNALLSVQMLTNWNAFSSHERSFEQLRVGAAYKTYQFGIAMDFDQYSELPITKKSAGLFIRKIFIN